MERAKSPMMQVRRKKAWQGFLLTMFFLYPLTSSDAEPQHVTAKAKIKKPTVMMEAAKPKEINVNLQRKVSSVPSMAAFSQTPFLVATPQGDVIYPPVAMSQTGQFIVIVLPDRILRSRDYGVTFQVARIENAPAAANPPM